MLVWEWWKYGSSGINFEGVVTQNYYNDQQKERKSKESKT